MRRTKEQKLAGKDLLAFDFGHHTSKMVYGKLNRSLIVVENAVTFPTPAGTIEKGSIIDAPLLANHLRELLRSEKIRASLAIATIEHPEIISREIVLPTASEEQMTKILEFEAQQYLPIEMDSHIVQSKMIGTLQDGDVKKTRFLTTAMPEYMAKSYYNLFQTASLNGAVLDMQSNSIDKLIQAGHLMGNGEGFAEKTSVLIDFGYSHINVMLFDNGAYKLNRIIAQGAEGIDRNLMSFLGHSRREADEIKHSKVDLREMLSENFQEFNGYDENILRARNVVKTVIDGWVSELERIFRFFTSRADVSSIDVLHVYGGITSLPGFNVYLQEATGIEARCLTDLANVTFTGTTPESVTPFLNALGSMLRR
jgi:type IV pilus assembly protein PilM